jgi:hypothetical protein
MAYWHLREKCFGTVWDDLGCSRPADVPVLFPRSAENPAMWFPAPRAVKSAAVTPACLKPADRIVGPPAFDQNPEVQADPCKNW